jgi:hypothetical protein
MASFAHKSVSKTVTSLARTVGEKPLGWKTMMPESLSFTNNQTLQEKFLRLVTFPGKK